MRGVMLALLGELSSALAHLSDFDDVRKRYHQLKGAESGAAAKNADKENSAAAKDAKDAAAAEPQPQPQAHEQVVC